jgi:hypothetical protein
MSQARNVRRLAKKKPSVDRTLSALEGLTKVAGGMPQIAQAVADVQHAAALLVEDNQKFQRRIDRLEYVLTEMVGNAYDLLGSCFGPRLNERHPQVDWEARRKLYEDEYDKQHPDPGEET